MIFIQVKPESLSDNFLKVTIMTLKSDPTETLLDKSRNTFEHLITILILSCRKEILINNLAFCGYVLPFSLKFYLQI